MNDIPSTAFTPTSTWVASSALVAAKEQELASISSRWFWGIIGLHVLLWTFVPCILRYALPMDALEGTVWGHQLELGYDRNPWLNAWLTRLAVDMGGTSGWMVYLFSQLCVLLAFFCVWRLGRKILNPVHALIAVLMLEAIQYYTLAAVDFNDNVLELGLWPLMTLLFYRALTNTKYRDWIVLGIVAALALMAKYYTAILLLVMLFFIFAEPKARKSLRNKGLYLGAFIFILVILPHFIWLFQHDFVTMRYASLRVNENSSTTFWQYTQPALHFALMQLLAFAGAALLFCFTLGKKNSAEPKCAPISVFDQRFLWVMGTFVYVITVLLGISTGWQLHTLWGTPLLSFWGLLLVAFVRPCITKVRFQRFVAAVLVVFTIYLAAYIISMTAPGSHSSGNFPAQPFANTITQKWQQDYHQPLHYVAGDRYLAGYIAFYSKDKPAVYIEWNSNKSPWIDEQELRKEGAVFIMPANGSTQFPQKILQRFPSLKVWPVFQLVRKRADKHSDSIKMLIGFLPPTKRQGHPQGTPPHWAFN